jgi:hypothetical protein
MRQLLVWTLNIWPAFLKSNEHGWRGLFWPPIPLCNAFIPCFFALSQNQCKPLLPYLQIIWLNFLHVMVLQLILCHNRASVLCQSFWCRLVSNLVVPTETRSDVIQQICSWARQLIWQPPVRHLGKKLQELFVEKSRLYHTFLFLNNCRDSIKFCLQYQNKLSLIFKWFRSIKV